MKCSTSLKHKVQFAVLEPSVTGAVIFQRPSFKLCQRNKNAPDMPSILQSQFADSGDSCCLFSRYLSPLTQRHQKGRDLRIIALFSVLQPRYFDGGPFASAEVLAPLF